MDDPTMYMCNENHCFNKPALGKNSPPPPQKRKKNKKKKLYSCSFFSKPILDITIFTLNIRHSKCSDTLFFLKRHLFNVPYVYGHVPNRVFLLSINARTPKTCPLFPIKLLFFTTGIFCIFALFTCVSG